MTSSTSTSAAPTAPSAPAPEAGSPRSSLPFTSVTETAASWLNEPARWRFEDGALVVGVERGTDFWRHTHHGFVRDSGHLLAVREPGDVVASVDVDADYRDRYDQAGLMVRLDAEHWLKAGIELDGGYHLSTVVTHERSDWSVTRLAARPDSLALRVTRSGDTVTVEYSLAGGPAGGADPVVWQLHRLAWFPRGVPLLVGPMAAAPEGPGFTARFRHWVVQR